MNQIGSSSTLHRSSLHHGRGSAALRRPVFGKTATGVILVLSTLMALGRDAQAIPPALVELVPSEPIAAYILAGESATQSPPTSRTPGSPLEVASFLADQATRMGMLSRAETSSRIWFDVVASLSPLLSHPHAGVLFDIKANARSDGGHQLAGINAAIILHSENKYERIEQRIQHLLSTYTNSRQSTLVKKTFDDSTVFTLNDERLPAWAELSWGAVRDSYIIAIGPGAFERAANTVTGRTEGLVHNEWFARSFRSAEGDAATSALFIDFERLRHGADGSLLRKINNALRPLGLGPVDRLLWTVGHKERSLEVVSVSSGLNGDIITRVAGEALLPKTPISVVPARATRFAAFDLNPLTLFRGVRQAYLASRSPTSRRKSMECWSQFEEDSGVSIEKDLFAHLKGPIVVHDYPRHLLNLPLARTFLARINGDARTVRKDVDRLMRSIQESQPDSNLVRLQRIPGGIWFMQFGIAGPALAVTDDWLILSYSPQAVLANVRYLAGD